MNDENTAEAARAVEALKAPASAAVDALAEAEDHFEELVLHLERNDADPKLIDALIGHIVAASGRFASAVERSVDVVEHDQATLCRRLRPLDVGFFVAEDETRGFRCVPEDGYWTVRFEVLAAGGRVEPGRWRDSVLCRRAIALTAPGWKLTPERQRELEDLAIEQAREKLELVEEMVRFGGQCVNHPCERFEYLGQGDECDVCGHATLCSDGVTNFRRMREALS